MKRIISVILAVIMSLSFVSVLQVPTWAMTYSGTCGDNVTWTLDTETGVLEINGTGKMDRYDFHFDEVPPWNAYAESIKTVKIGDGITGIGMGAFDEDTEIYYGKSICDWVNITDASTPMDALIYYKYVAKCADNTHKSLSCEVVSKATATEMGIYKISCADCRMDVSLGYYSDGKNVSIAYATGSGTLIYLELPSYIDGVPVTSINNNAFSDFRILAKIDIPDSVKSIGYCAFEHCTNLKYVTLGKSVESIGVSAFEDYFGLLEISYSGYQSDWDKIKNPSNYKAICKSDSFTDISNCSSGIKTAINWAADQGIINGYSDETFKPYDSCTRQQMVIMLWRLAGKPEPVSIDSALKFTDTNDLSAGSKKAIAWAVEKGIVSGYKDGSFDPTGNVTRQQTVVMLWRLAGKPEAKTTSTFTDTANCSAGVMKAINWAASVGITKGSSNGDGTYRFAPDDNCQRQHIATFVYRYAKLMN